MKRGRHFVGHMTNSVVEDIRRRYWELGWTARELNEKYAGYSAATLYAAATGRTYRHLPVPPKRKRVFRHNGKRLSEGVVRDILSSYEQGTKHTRQRGESVAEIARRLKLPRSLIDRVTRFRFEGENI